MTLVCNSHGTGNKFHNPIQYGEVQIPQGINPKYGLKDRPCPDDSKKVQHSYVSLRVLEISFLTLFMGVGVT